MTKKRTASEPIVAEEPVKPDEQFKLEEGTVAPPSTYVRGNRPSARSAPKSYGARTARERRAGRSDTPRRESSKSEEYRAEVVTELLRNPTRTVTEAQLREEYSYVLADIRSMFILAAGLIAALIVLAQVLPK